MSSKNKDLPGNALGSAALFAKEMVRTGERLVSAERVIERYDDNQMVLTAIRIVLPGYRRMDYLVVVQGEQDGRRVVAFHNAGTLRDAIVGVLDRLDNESLKFKEERPFGE